MRGYTLGGSGWGALEMTPAPYCCRIRKHGPQHCHIHHALPQRTGRGFSFAEEGSAHSPRSRFDRSAAEGGCVTTAGFFA